MAVQRRLAAILAADVAGYARLIGADEAGTRARLNDCLATVIEPAIAEHGGRLVKTMGDGFLVEHGSVLGAVQAAVDIQAAMARLNQDEPEDRRMDLRIGIHLGDVIIEGEDIHGEGVNIAARIEALAEPGGICVSDMVHAGVRNKLAIALDDMGERSLKNIADPLQVYRCVAADRSAEAPAGAGAAFLRPAIAVLPFDNLSGDPEQEYFADGLTEDIITALSRWRMFPVIARNSTFAYKGKSTDVRQIGEALAARYVVEGSVRKAGGRVRITAQLIDAETGHHVWAERYDRDLADIFALQDEITEAIAAIIEPTVERTEHQRIIARPPSDLTAWEHGLRGYSYIYDGTKEGNAKAQDMFMRAIELDPNFARAHTGLAYTYIRDLRYFRVLDREECVRLTFEHSRAAIALDEMESEARTMLARAYGFAKQLDAAVAEARRAVEINAYDAVANNILGAMLSLASARYDEGVPWFERALKLNPLDPQYHLYLTQIALAKLGAGRYAAAADHAREALRRKPDFLEARIALASSLGHSGPSEQAPAVVSEIDDSAKDYVETHILYADDLKDRVLDGLRKAGREG